MDELRGKLVIKGERGYSAYEIAVKNGYEGTEQDWIDHFGLDLTDYAKTNEVIDYVGDVDDLTTTDKTSVVNAINEHQTDIQALDTRGIYLTSETVVGVWIDGKPIYRKVISFTTGTNNVFKNITFDEQSVVDTVVKLDGYFNRDTDIWQPLNSIRAADTFSLLLFNKTNGIQSYVSQSSGTYSNLPAFVIIEYTKTTD